MSTVIFHFLFCSRILLGIIQRIPTPPPSLSQESTYEELLLKRYDDDHGDLAHAQTPRSALLRVRLLLQLAGWEQDSDRYYLRLLHTDTHTTGWARWTWLLTWSACALARISGSQRPRWGVGGVDRLLDYLLRLRQTSTAPTPAGSLMSHTWDEVMSIDHGG